jgi:gamma-glutamylcyclotransferase (GGCT)/AIG2-like uncharacterized protein YtfP
VAARERLLMGAVRLPFAFYGTLRPGGGALDRLGITERVTHLGPCLLRGDLYAVTWYPGLVEGDRLVRGDLFDVPDDLVPMLDEFEGWFPDRPDRSEYVRLADRLVDPDVEAWVYRWRGPVSNGILVAHGDWLEHTAGSPLPEALERPHLRAPTGGAR